ncbi:hypothetical protein, partial [Bifidobacterium moraviense]|uniref:hypothetical protein n=1 Tax=Bifidobacterium moraviense TaxID=2675323 RepID=UPI00145F3518
GGTGARRATRITAAFVLLLTAIIVVDVTLLGMGAVATFGTCLTAMALFAGRRFRRRVLGRA